MTFSLGVHPYSVTYLFDAFESAVLAKNGHLATWLLSGKIEKPAIVLSLPRCI